ncbi:Curli production assembly/transport component CsgG [Phycisphaerae bacterium RAS1]|nr:Curli production assembly/transport component CsgG [Phycisphaerae bacterium RAS1]
MMKSPGRSPLPPRALSAILLAALLPFSGCGEGKRRAEVTQFPAWDFQEYPRILVVPIKAADKNARAAAERATGVLVDQLAASGAFEVLSAAERAAILKEQDLSRLEDVADADTAIPAGKIKTAQALVVGQITTWQTDVQQQQQQVPRYARARNGRIVRDARTHQPVVTGYDVYVSVRHVARVAGSLQVIDTATGKVLLSHSVAPIELEDHGRGGPPSQSPQDLALQATLEMATEFAKRVAPQRIAVKLSGKNLFVATEYYEGRYEDTKKLPASLSNFLLVVSNLPRECDRNDFRVEITAVDGRETLFQEQFTWSHSWGVRGRACEVPISVLEASGATAFSAKLYSAGDDAPILKTEFRLEVPKGAKRKSKEEA